MFLEGEIKTIERKRKCVEVELRLNNVSCVCCVISGDMVQYTQGLNTGDHIRVAGKIHRDKLRVKLIEK